MNFESIQPTESPEGKKMRVGNEIQMCLMSLNCSPDEGEDCIEKWKDTYSKKFREIFEREFGSNPQLLDEWDKNPNRISDFFQGELSDMSSNSEERKAA